MKRQPRSTHCTHNAALSWRRDANLSVFLDGADHNGSKPASPPTPVYVDLHLANDGFACVPIVAPVTLDKSGATPSDLPRIFERLKLDVGNWKLLVSDFGRLFSSVAGAPKDVYEMRSLISKRRFYLKHPLQSAITGP